MHANSTRCAGQKLLGTNSRLFLVLCHAVGTCAVLAEHMPLLRGGNSPSFVGPRAERETQLASRRQEHKLGHSGVRCPAGRYWKDRKGGSLVSCEYCPPGHFKEIQGDRKPCAQCPLGKFQDAKGRTTCEWCPAGRFVNRFAMSQCALCPQGKFLPWRYGNDEGGGYGGFTWHRKVNKKPWVDGGFQGKGWGVYVRDQQIPPLHKSTLAGLRKYYGRACGEWCSSASDPRRPHDPYHVLEREQPAT